MTSSEVPADDVKGPAAYFPSIEHKYGQPISHWMKVLDDAGDLKHMQLVDVLKNDHGIGHGHATALVAHHRASSTSG